MKIFFLLIELLVPIFAVFMIWKKGQLSIVYLPFIFFCNDLVEKSLPASITYFLHIAIVGYYAVHNFGFAKRNIFSVLLIVYFLLLLPYSADIEAIRSHFVAALLLFLLIPIIAEVFRKYPKHAIFEELSRSALLILLIFIVNVIGSTYFRYMPLGAGFYGATSGLLYGFLSLDNLNVLPFAAYVVLRKGARDKQVWYIAVYLIVTFFVLLTFRRTVMAITVIAGIAVLIELLNFRQIQHFLKYAVTIALVSVFVIYQTGFSELFWARYEMRELDERGVEKEPRLMEFQMIYKDLFVYYDYNPWFGYGLFESTGNYAKGQLGKRSLHTDFGTIVHSSGVLGFLLYSLMVATAFISVWKRLKSREDYFRFFFCVLAFITFFMSGRWYTVSAMTMMYCLLTLPLGRSRAIVKIKRPAILKMEKKMLFLN